MADEAQRRGIAAIVSAGVTFANIGHVALIGGGDLMLYTATRLRACGVAVTAILAPRHAGEVLALGGRPAREMFAAAGIGVELIDDINHCPGLTSRDWVGATRLALCFGSAWIFTAGVRAAFGLGMFNFNGIPIPHYLGGAHYTWQILNRDRQGGCVLQEIGAAVDRGRILRRELHELPEHVRTPRDYFIANNDIGRKFLDRVIADMLAGVTFPPTEFGRFEDERLYFPRLNTLANAFIDWSWSVHDIEAFCCAFDDPYVGAASFMDGREVRLHDVFVDDDAIACHPFTAGIVVRRRGNRVWIAAHGGILRVGTVCDRAGNDMTAIMKEGNRLHTPMSTLEAALSYRFRLGAHAVPKPGHV